MKEAQEIYKTGVEARKALILSRIANPQPKKDALDKKFIEKK